MHLPVSNKIARPCFEDLWDRTFEEVQDEYDSFPQKDVTVSKKYLDTLRILEKAKIKMMNDMTPNYRESETKQSARHELIQKLESQNALMLLKLQNKQDKSR